MLVLPCYRQMQLPPHQVPSLFTDFGSIHPLEKKTKRTENSVFNHQRKVMCKRKDKWIYFSKEANVRELKRKTFILIPNFLI